MRIDHCRLVKVCAPGNDMHDNRRFAFRKEHTVAQCAREAALSYGMVDDKDTRPRLFTFEGIFRKDPQSLVGDLLDDDTVYVVEVVEPDG